MKIYTVSELDNAYMKSKINISETVMNFTYHTCV